MLKKDFPIYMNRIKVPWPTKWQEKRTVVENIAQTEAGTDVVTVVRKRKLTISCAFKCSSNCAGLFTYLSLQNTVTVKAYDPVMNDYVENQMRVRNFTSNLVENSEKTPDTHGLYEISFDLIEF